MTRWSLGQLKTDTGIGTVEVANRMADYGVDPYWMSHEPWVVPEPFTPEAGEMYSKEDLDYWVAVIAKVSEEAYANPDFVKSGAAQPADPPDQGRLARRSGEMGDDLARLFAQAWIEEGESRRRASIACGGIGVVCMSKFKVAASTFPFLYSHSGIGALEHLASLGYGAFEMMIFPPHCWPADMSISERSAVKSKLDGEGWTLSSFCYPLLDNNPNSVDRLMRRYTLDRYKEAIELANDWGCPYVCAIPGPVNSLINPPDDWMRNWFIEGMKELVDYAKGSDVEIILENVPFTFLPTARRHAEGRQ